MIPFIFLTSRDGADEMRRGMTSGADDYLVKPFSEADLLATIDVRLRKSAILQREYGRAPQRLNEFIADAAEHGGIPGIDVGDRPRKYGAGQILYGEGTPPTTSTTSRRAWSKCSGRTATARSSSSSSARPAISSGTWTS